MKKLIFTTSLFLFLSTSVSARIAKVNGMWFDFDYDKETAEVIAPLNGEKYTGEIVIPSWFPFDEGESESYTVTSIASEAFYMSDITSVSIPNSVTSIGDKAFKGCTLLTSVNIPVSITAINESVFENCRSLKRVDLPASITTIGTSAFAGCTSLKSIDLSVNVRNIGSYAFSNTGLTFVDIPNSITYISSYAFYCSNLAAVNIPESVKTINSYAFSETKLKSVTIPRSVYSIAEYAFYGCTDLSTIYFKGNTRIGDCSFGGCSAITSVTIESYGFNIYNIGSSTFANSISNATLYVPYKRKSEFEADENWNQFKEIVESEWLQCAIPTITFVDGKIHFECETEGVTFISSIIFPDSSGTNGQDIDFNSDVKISVYATKDGYENSWTTSKTIKLRSLKGDVNEDGEVNITDVTNVIDIINKK